MSDIQIEELAKWAGETQSDGLPEIILPGNAESITACGEKLFGLIGPTNRMFYRGGSVMVVVPREDGQVVLSILRAATARSLFEKFGELRCWRSGRNGELMLKATVCTHDMAEALLRSEEAQRLLPKVRGLSNCAVIREVKGILGVAGSGYDVETGLFITGGDTPPMVPLSQAVPALKGLFEQFYFQTAGDLARAMASLLTPALRMGGLFRGRVPADTAEADQSQSGKTYRQQILAAIYGEKLSLVTQREGGVGSVDESFCQAMVAGRPFIQLDNFRGRFSSPTIETFMTADGDFPCRVPHLGTIYVNPEGFFLMLTSNGVDTTPDFAKRSNIIRIYKAPAGFAFKRFPDGGLLDHVRAKQAYYLGCIFAVVREWYRRGKPRTDETRHDFRDWVQTLDWICQNLIGTVPIMDGHQQAQERVSNPAMVWLRAVVLAVVDADELGRDLTATDLFELSDTAGLSIPGVQTGAPVDKARKIIGSMMGKIFRDGGSCEVEVEGFLVTRTEKYLPRHDPTEGGNLKSKVYTITRRAPAGASAQLPQQGV